MSCYIGKMIGGNSALLLICNNGSNSLALDADCIINLSFLRCCIKNGENLCRFFIKKEEKDNKIEIKLSFCMKLAITEQNLKNLEDLKNLEKDLTKLKDFLKTKKKDDKKEKKEFLKEICNDYQKNNRQELEICKLIASIDEYIDFVERL
ncbi:MAG: hypothetical protein M0022_05410 [Desulfobacteraceae bacterium]|nr:hypothetical protein [Desulfobacteraceae bacterium]